MKKLERILIPTDFSLFAQAATEVGISLAKKFDSSLTFLHVIIPAPYSSPTEGALKRRAEERFKILRERLEQEEVNVDKFTVVLGKPVNEILKVAEYNNFNVIIMGACGGEKSQQYYEDGQGQWFSVWHVVQRKSCLPGCSGNTGTQSGCN